MKVKIPLLIVLIGAVTVGLQFVNSVTASAADARNYNAGRIIDDGVFANKSSMTVADIQYFLNTKVPNCDTYGQKTSELGGGQRWQWLSAHGISTPITCLKDYYENPSTGQNNYGKAIPAGAISAAQIIYNYAQQFNINPQTLIVTLQKENGLITDDWPTPKQYSESMGFGCPDNVAPGAPACDPQYGSFSTQIYQAARHFRGFMDNTPGWFIPFSTGNNSIAWSPNASCGRGNVSIENRSTVALYSYTPYQPNQAAKNAQYGMGDGCSAYGNRNFYLYFTDWFGSVYGSVNLTSPIVISSSYSQGLFTDKTITAQFSIKNNSNQRQDLGTMAIAVRDQNGANFDFGSQNIVLSPWQNYYYTATRTLSSEGKYSFSIVNYRDGIGWSSDYPLSTFARSKNDMIVADIPTVTTAPYFTNTNLHVGQSTSIRMVVKNNSSLYPVNLGYFGLAATSPTGGNADLPFDTVTSLAPGASYEYAKTFTPAQVGKYSARVSSTGDGGLTWSETAYPAAVAPANNRTEITVKSNPTLTSGLSIEGGQYVGDDGTGSFTVKNFSDSSVDVNKRLCYIVRSQTGKNNDLGCLVIGTLAPGQELTYTGSRRMTEPGNYTGYFSMFDGAKWYDNWTFEQETGSEPTKVNFTVKDNPVITQGLTINTAIPRVGDSVSGSFALKNNSSQSVAINKSLCFILRGPNGQNYDLGCQAISTLTAGQAVTFNGASPQLRDAGRYTGYFSMFDGTKWYDNWTFAKATGLEQTRVQFDAKSTPTLTQGLTVSSTSPGLGDLVTGSFKVKNSSSSSAVVNKSLCYIVRGSSGSNNDLGCLAIGTLAPGQELVYTGSRTFSVAGQYTGYFSMFDGAWHDNWTFEKETGSEPTKVNFTVQ